MKNGLKILRRYIFPAALTAAAVYFWFQYQCGAPVIWLYLVGGILALHYGIYFWKSKKERRIQADLPDAEIW